MARKLSQEEKLLKMQWNKAAQGREITDFQLMIVIGTGSFGKVYLGRLPDQNPVAIKSLKKSHVLEMNQLDHLKSEKNVLCLVDSPFIVKLYDGAFGQAAARAVDAARGRLCRYETFQDKTNVYFVFEFVPGGELFRILRREKLFPNDVAMFYCAEVIMALAHLHERNIVYRDLKPENILIDSEGHTKLTDFGFSKQLADAKKKTQTVCGTPEYLAPEIIMQKGHGLAVDWWSLGVLTFEMLTGYQPFYDQDPQKIYKKILSAPLYLPSHVSENAKQFLTGLLNKKDDKRLGTGKDGTQNVLKQAWFAGIDWQCVREREVQPPWVPALSSATDFQYFEQYPDSGGRVNEPIPEHQNLFLNF